MNRASSATGWVRNPDGTLGYTCNPITGCRNHDNGLCRGGGFPCYACKLANGRLKPLYLANKNIAPAVQETDVFYNQGYHRTSPIYSSVALLDPFYPRLWPERMGKLLDAYLFGRRTRRGIFLCDMSDPFGIGIPAAWTRNMLFDLKQCPEWRFYLLTKQPGNLPKFSPFPDNCWVGQTITTGWDMMARLMEFWKVEAHLKFLSFEPLLEDPMKPEFPTHAKILTGFLAGQLREAGVGWIIIGACTGTKAGMTLLVRKYPALTLMPYGKIWTAQPKIEWVQELVEAAGQAGIPVFLKDNLKPLLKDGDAPNCYSHRSIYGWELRQEIPK